MRGPWAFLGRSKGHLEFIFDQRGKEDEKERLDFQKKTLKILCFSMVFEGPEDSFWMTLGVLLGSCWGSLGGLGGLLDAWWPSWKRLGRVWECLGTLRSV